MYADDVAFYVSDETLSTAATRLQSDATRVFDWFSSSGLCINTDKTKIVIFAPTKPPAPLSVHVRMGAALLETCDQYDYLGIILDNEFTLEKSVSKSVSNANFRSVMLRKMRTKMSTPTAKLVYKQTIFL